MKFLPVFAATIALTAFSTLVHAAPASSAHITPVKWILDTQHDLDVDGKAVTLVGKVVKRDGGSDWWFSDTTGSVRLEAGEKELPVGQTIIVHGHIDQARFGIGYLEVEVKQWEPAHR